MSKMHIWNVLFLSMQLFVTADWVPIPSLKDNEMEVVKSDPYKIGNSLHFLTLGPNRSKKIQNAVTKKFQ